MPKLKPTWAIMMWPGRALSSYLSDRITDVSYIDNLSGQQLKDEINLQTRIELWGEGKSLSRYEKR